VVWTASLVSLLALAVLADCIGWMVRDRAVQKAARSAQAEEALQEAIELREQRNWPEALAEMKRAEGLVATGTDAELAQRVREVRRDLEMIIQLEKVRFGSRFDDLIGFDVQTRNRGYSAVFHENGLDVTALEPAQAAERIAAKSKSIRTELIAALDDWAFMGCDSPSQRAQLLAIVRAVDADEWRNQLREALERGEVRVLKQLAASRHVLDLPPSSLNLFGNYLARMGAVDDAVALLRKCQMRHLANFWLNVSLADWLQFTNPPQFDQAIGYYRAALALRPKSGPLHCDFGIVLRRKGLLEEAERAYRQAIELEPGLADAHSCLIGLSALQGKLAQADEACAEAQKRIPNFARWLNNRAWHIVNFPMFFFHRSDQRLAVACAKKASEIAPEAAYAWNTLGTAYYRAGQWNKAVAALEKSMAIRRGGDSFDWFFLAMAHQKLGHEKEARRWYDQARLWMDKNEPRHEELRRFRSEAAKLLQLPEKNAFSREP
jgi:tetratricopeptide (TPR) repeat protein